jgi:hypothetical protein
MEFLDFLKSLLRSCVDGLRRNKLPTALSLIALVLATALASTGEYDERPRFRKLALPQIGKVEQQFFDIMQEVEREPDELRRLHYLLEGHRRAKAALQVIKTERPVSAAGRKAHRELVRYYELVNEYLAIIRTEMSFDESFDYVAEWKLRSAELMPIREEWIRWIQPSS